MSQPTKVLHVLGGLKRGGAETWFVQLLDHLDRERFVVDVATVADSEDHAYRERAEAMGCRVFSLGGKSDLPGFARRFTDVLQRNGPYQVVHAHLQLFSGILVKLAHDAGVPRRIAHSRNSTDGAATSVKRTIYTGLMRGLIARHATHRLAVSRDAGVGAFGPVHGGEAHCRVMTGLDFSEFTGKVDTASVRAALGLPEGARVLGHVGSFSAQKNHGLLVRIVEKLVDANPEVIALLVGDGALEPRIAKLIDKTRHPGAFRLIGVRDDVPELMMGAMDAFVLPSLYEGRPRALMEAQAAGLPCVASSIITDEAAATNDSVEYLGLDEPIDSWVDKLDAALLEGRSVALGAAAIEAFGHKEVTIEANARMLERIYFEGAR